MDKTGGVRFLKPTQELQLQEQYEGYPQMNLPQQEYAQQGYVLAQQTDRHYLEQMAWERQ